MCLVKQVGSWIAWTIECGTGPWRNCSGSNVTEFKCRIHLKSRLRLNSACPRSPGNRYFMGSLLHSNGTLNIDSTPDANITALDPKKLDPKKPQHSNSLTYWIAGAIVAAIAMALIAP